MTLLGQISARASREVERELRSAILRLCDMTTDVVIADDGRGRYDFDRQFELDRLVESLRDAIRQQRAYGYIMDRERVERALQVSRARSHGRGSAKREAAASSATVTPAPATMRALPQSTGGGAQLLLPPATKRGGSDEP